MSAHVRDETEPEPLSSAPTLAASAFDRAVTSVDDAEAKLTAVWDVQGIDIATIQFKGDTVVHRHDDAPQSTRVGTLPTLLAPGPLGAEPQFEIGDVLGEGGMGVVRTAQQLALRREVAVKTLKPEASEREAPQLLREARVTGVLEHPNVVPIYALGRDNDNRPLIVMKRISGDGWGTELLDATPEERLTDAYLLKHLAILKQVAVAVHYAHSKGIIHRDLKPDNVMTGDFGEVYVVDWGIAVSLERGTPGVPCVRDITAIEGTPGYMSPEMAAAEGSLIDERSDVYLLGAILHEIVTGEPPHSGATIKMVLVSAFASEPHEYAPGVPLDLVAICHRAMARFSEDRFASALAFADALDEFVTHRSSTLLSDEATLRLRSARAVFDPTKVGPTRRSEQTYAKLSECRFAFTQALRSWPENEGATAGLQETLELMVAHELARDAPRTALSLVLQLPRPNETLRSRVDAAIAAKQRAEARFAELERDKDMSIGAGNRRLIGLIVSSLWGVACILCGFLTRSGVVEVTHNAFAVVAACFAAATWLGAWSQRTSVLITDFNRRLAVFTIVVFSTYAGLWMFSGLAGIAKMQAALLQSLVGIALWTSVGLTLNRLWLIIAYGAVMAVVLMTLFPVYYWEMLGLSGGISSVITTHRSYDLPKS